MVGFACVGVVGIAGWMRAKRRGRYERRKGMQMGIAAIAGVTEGSGVDAGVVVNEKVWGSVRITVSHVIRQSERVGPGR